MALQPVLGLAATAAAPNRSAGPGNGLLRPERKEDGRAVAAVASLVLPRLISSQSGLLALDKDLVAIQIIGFLDHQSVARVVTCCRLAWQQLTAPVETRILAHFLHSTSGRWINSALSEAPNLIGTYMAQMTEQERGSCLIQAAGGENPASVSFIHALLARGEISQTNLRKAMRGAGGKAGPASLSIIQALWGHEKISGEELGWALHDAARNGGYAALTIVNALLARGGISNEDLGEALAAAAQSVGPASRAIMDALLAGGTISEDDQDVAVLAAAETEGQGPASLDIVRDRLRRGPMSEDRLGSGVINAAESANPSSLDIINVLLGSGDISEDDRRLALEAAEGSANPARAAIISRLRGL